MFKYKKILVMFLNVIFLAMPLITLAEDSVPTVGGYVTPSDTGLPTATDLSVVITNIMNWLLGVVGVVGIISFVVAGILYFLAAGDESKMGTAKNAMTYSIIGVVVALIGYVVIQAVNSLLGGTSSTF